MVSKLKIKTRKELADPEGEYVRKKAEAYFGFSVADVRVIRVLAIDAPFSAHQLEQIRREIFTNPVTQESSYSSLASPCDWLIWVGLRPGVKDTAGSTAVEAIEDFLGPSFGAGQSVYASKIYEIRGDLGENEVRRIAEELLANPLIQRWRVYQGQEWPKELDTDLLVPKVELNHQPSLSTVGISSDEELKRISGERNLALHDSDIPVIRKYFQRQDVQKERQEVGLDLPTDVELEYISQARSDHCNHNTFKGLFRYYDLSTGHKEVVDNLFKTCIESPTLQIKKKKDWVVSVLWDNAGVGKFDSEFNYVITGETHNSPSNIEAYGGAITGIVGIYRDPMGTGKGSKLITGTYAYCVAPRDYKGVLVPHLHPRRLLDGIVEGVRDGGNKSGVPTPFGLLVFDESYLGKCLVFVTALGLMPAKINSQPSHEKTTTPEDLIIMCGGRVGKDGIHGVTAASEEYGEKTPAGHVQIGDPYTQKKMHDFLLEARDEGLISFITDNGGGGLSSSVGESARFSGGCHVDLDKVPLKYEGLDIWEIWVSESQERMTVGVAPESLDRFMALARRHSVESTVIGKYTDSGYLHLEYEGKTCAHIRMDLLESDFPQWEFEAEWAPPEIRGLTEPVLTEPQDHTSLLAAMLSRPNICARNWIARQYDHEVQGGSIIKPLVGKGRDMPSDGCVVRPVLHSNRGIAVSQALNPFYSKIDTYHMTALTIDEAIRRVLAVGGNPWHLGGVDNFCWPSIQYHPKENPDGKYKAAQLVRAGWALRDYCLAYGIPLLSGKDSMYIDGHLQGPFGERRKVSGLPTLLFTVVSVVDDISQCLTMDAKLPGDLVYILGETKDELGGSEFYQMLGAVGLNVPKINVQELMPGYQALFNAVKERLVSSCHSITRGGLAVHLAMVAMAGETGMEIHLPRVIHQGLSPTQFLYSESGGRFVITVPPERKDRFETLFSGQRIALVGKVTDSPYFVIRGPHEEPLIEERIHRLKDEWKRPFGDLI